MRRFPARSLTAYHRARRTGQVQASPPVVLAGSFIALILAGTLLLMLPFAQRQPFGLFAALFTAVSSVTVTGMSVIDPVRDLTLFGQVIVLGLIQIGGIGFMTFAIVATLTLGKSVSLKYQALALEAFNQTSVARIRQTALTVLKFSLAIEMSAILFLTLWWWRHDDLSHAFLLAGFHVVSAFNNAGVTLFPDSLERFTGDPVTLFVLTGSVILGGLGFSVLADLYHKHRWTQLGYYTRLILLATLMINLAGFGLFWLIEATNPETLGALSRVNQGLAAWTQVVSARTAGFSAVDASALRDSSRFLLAGLMFIGGGSLSTASGIKLGTFIVLIAVARAYVFQHRDVVVMHRTLSQETIHKALALLMVSGLLVCLGIFLMSLFEDLPFMDVFTEVLSAFSTAGMSTGVTPTLGTPGKVLLMLLMFVGRLGPLTLVYNLGHRRSRRVRYPETQIQIG